MTTNRDFNVEVRFDILEHIGVLATHSTGWRKEINLVRWNGGQPKYDIRDWSPDYQHMSKGITLHEKEMRQIFEFMKQRRLRDRRRMQNHWDAEESAVPADSGGADVEETIHAASPEAPTSVPDAPAAPPVDFPMQQEDDFGSVEIAAS